MNVHYIIRVSTQQCEEEPSVEANEEEVKGGETDCSGSKGFSSLYIKS